MKISQLLLTFPAAPLDGSEGFHVKQGSDSAGATVEQVADYTLSRDADIVAAVNAALGGTGWQGGGGATAFTGLSDVPGAYTGAGGQGVRVNAGATALEFYTLPTITGSNTGDQTTIVGITGSLAEFNAALTGADFATGGGTVTGASSGTNTGDQTSIVGITGTLAEFNAALTGADFATGGGTATGTNTGDQLVFKTISVAGQSDVVADGTTDTLTLVAGSGITITTDPTTDAITITGAAGATAFTGLSDVPSAYTGAGLKPVRVNSGATALEFGTIYPPDVMALSDETSNLTTGQKLAFRVVGARTLTSIRLSVGTAPTGSTVIVDVKTNGTTIFTTKLSIDASEKTSVTAASAFAFTGTPTFADDDEVTCHIDQIGSTVAGAGAKIAFIWG